LDNIFYNVIEKFSTNLNQDFFLPIDNLGNSLIEEKKTLDQQRQKNRLN